MPSVIPYIGDQIRARRLSLGLTQRQVAEKAHLTQARVSEVEKGGDARLSTLLMIAGALDLEIFPVPKHYSSLVRSVLSSSAGPVVGTARQ
jgi:transcriptional regulator with XRE-family HTH domain